MEKLFEVKKLNMHFPVTDALSGQTRGYVYALSNVDLTIYKNEILGLVGESGSGKSTLGNCILRLLKPTSGNIIFGGEDITNKPLSEMKNFRKRTGIVFQNPYTSLNPRMKIYETLREPFIIHGEKSNEVIDKKIKNILSVTGFGEDILARYPNEFSGGQRQRIAIARAVLLNPEFIVADEPVSALDVSIRAQIINMLADLKKELELTMLFISHDLSVVKFISDRIAVLYLGEIVELAEKDKFFGDYKHPYSKALLYSVPGMKNKTEEKVLTDGELPSPSSPPNGCKFHTRCPLATDRCNKEHPELKDIGKNHYVRCFLYDN